MLIVLFLYKSRQYDNVPAKNFICKKSDNYKYLCDKFLY